MYFVSDSSLWNHEFLKNDIFGHIGETKDVLYKNKDHLLNIGFWNHIMTKKPHLAGNCIFHFCIGKRKHFNKNRTVNIDMLKDVIKLLNPKTIIYCGDEHFDYPELNEFGNLTTLFLREYNNPEYTLTNNTNIIPIGYNNGLGENTQVCLKPCTQREYIWSFIGEKKVFEGDILNPNEISFFKKFEYGHLGPCEKQDIRMTYNECIFVPITRKKNRIDSSAIYNVLSCGAIPVIVGTQDEFKEAFGYFLGTTCIPPWVHGDSWESVTEACKTILDDKEMLTQIQKNCIIWWQNILSIYRCVLDPLWEE